MRPARTPVKGAASSSSAVPPVVKTIAWYLRNDRLKFIILAGFVLFVFWGGVAVGVGFSHGHEHDHPPIGLFTMRSNRKQQQQQQQQPGVIPKLEDEDQPMVAKDCCQGENAECIACREHVPVSLFCLQHATTTGCAKVLPNPKSIFTGSKYVLGTEHTMDYSSISISAWIYVDSPPAGDAQMKTVLANRASGCEKEKNRHGYALYINEWNTDDRSVNMMWFTEQNPCTKLSTPPDSIKYKTWHQVGVTLTSTDKGRSTTAKIYIDGQLRASTISNSERILASSPNRFTVGSHIDGGMEHTFRGKIAHVTIAEGTSEALASSYPHFRPSVGAESGAKVTAYWEAFVGDIVKDTMATGLTLGKVQGPDSWQAGDGENQPDASAVQFLIPLGSPEDLASGLWPRESFFLTAEMKKKSDDLARERRELVRNAMKHAWGGYDSKAFGHDEVTPRSGQARDNWSGMAVTMVDALDTLWIMGMKTEFFKARDFCRDKLRFNNVGSVSTFETTIRVLGGLMSAYDLSGDKAFLDRAQDLGDRLSKAFQTNSGLPVPSVSLSNGAKGSGGHVVIAEVGTLQLEFRSLAYHTGEAKYAKMVENVHTKMRRAPPADGLWPIYVSVDTGMSAGGQVTFGALGDSFFEYLLKIWVQGGKVENEYLADYERAMDGVHKHIIQKSSPSGLLYLGDYNPGGSINHKMDHLACFVPGMLALGVKKRGESVENEHKNKRDLTIAKALAYTCVQMYERMPTGISAEYVLWQEGRDLVVPGNAPFYILRPEAVESLYILHAVTGHPVYRDWGHRIMLNIEKHCKLQYGYGALPDVRVPSRQPDDRMESFFLAETLKYLFLLQDPDSEINLDEFVFNTEAHPLRVFPPGWRQKIGLD